MDAIVCKGLRRTSLKEQDPQLRLPLDQFVCQRATCGTSANDDVVVGVVLVIDGQVVDGACRFTIVCIHLVFSEPFREGLLRGICIHEEGCISYYRMMDQGFRVGQKL